MRILRVAGHPAKCATCASARTDSSNTRPLNNNSSSRQYSQSIRVNPGRVRRIQEQLGDGEQLRGFLFWLPIPCPTLDCLIIGGSTQHRHCRGLRVRRTKY